MHFAYLFDFFALFDSVRISSALTKSFTQRSLISSREKLSDGQLIRLYISKHDDMAA